MLYSPPNYIDMVLDTIRRLENERAEKMDSPKSILTEAEGLVNGDRAAAYGPADVLFKKVADIFNILYNKDITSKDVVILHKLTKIVRESYKHKRDNLTDECGYAEIQSRLEGGE